MSRCFIRGIWGIDSNFFDRHKDEEFDFLKKFEYNKNNCCAIRRYNLNGFIESSISKIDKNLCHTYIYGKDNYDYFSKFGIKTTLVHDEPYKYHPIRRIWMHKIEIIKLAMEEYDEIVWLDWDCRLNKAIDEDFWNILNKKASFQAPLRRYKHVQNNLREKKSDNRFLPNGCFVYMRDKNIPIELSKNESWTDEKLYAIYTDKMMGGFNVDRYLELFEPMVASIGWSAYRIKKDECYFLHY